MTHGKCIWLEDEATLGMDGHKGLPAAWQRLFGEPFNCELAVEVEDLGDGTAYRMPCGHTVYSSYPGNSGIYAPEGP